MSYLVLARRFRPQRFEDLLGQEHVVQTLKNALRLSRIHHAYLFTGPRGVGKTSAARILAKALRCEQPSAEFEPCDVCESCQSITQGHSLDVIEIDAASNTGVDNVRDLRENVAFAATSGKYRIFIIDEVHMLSTAAFNALLKTLEEPPPHIIFIFATTELHKVPLTVKGRCQVFDFKRIPQDVMIKSLQAICEVEKISIDGEALKTIALESEGCLRDAQSLLDRAIALCGEKITQSELELSLGILDRKSLFSLFEGIATQNTAHTLKTLSSIFLRGVDAKVVVARLVDAFRDLHYFVFTKEFVSDESTFNELLKKLASQMSADQIIRGLDLALRTQAYLSQSTNAQYALESLVVKLCLQRPVAMGAVRQGDTARTPAPAPEMSRQYATTPKPSNNTMPPSTIPQASSALPNLDVLKEYILSKKPAWTPVLSSILEFKKEQDRLEISAKGDFGGKRLQTPDGIELLKAAYGVRNVSVQLEATPAPAQLAENAQEKIQKKQKQAKEHEAVQAALKNLGGVITQTRVLDDLKDERGKE